MSSVNNIVNGNESYNGKNNDKGNGIDNVEIVNDDVFAESNFSNHFLQCFQKVEPALNLLIDFNSEVQSITSPNHHKTS